MGLDFKGDDIGLWCRNKMRNKIESGEAEAIYSGATDAYIATRKCRMERGGLRIAAGEMVELYTGSTAPCHPITAECGTGGKFVREGQELSSVFPVCG
jgi:hypothetical protein